MTESEAAQVWFWFALFFGIMVAIAIYGAGFLGLVAAMSGFGLAASLGSALRSLDP